MRVQHVLTQNSIRLGVVNFLNAAPMIDGVTATEGVTLHAHVPSELIGSLEQGEVDIALASSIDYQRSTIDLCILPVGVLSSDGETLTVRLCSRTPLEDVTQIHCDTDSHTSIALLQIIMKHRFGKTPTIIDLDIRALGTLSSRWPDTVLMIGDKVVANKTETEYPFQLDLGQAWKEQTKLPFVFATWFGGKELAPTKVHKASMLLDRQLRLNTTRIEQVVSSYGSSRGWESALAYRYLTMHMQYSFTEQHSESLKLFYELAFSCGVIDHVRPIRYFEI